ncbi:unnamed protein product [Oppiella nova]|uniref:Uncharacterized protein n=1 Tax=Oppiella nova TaxID=334625 RepID=A0A7R9L9M0_9ACAR|nr:unnamed protein product [Oppiella nova]CAG2157442.1 unnamed protein product [Oppiella nova]
MVFEKLTQIRPVLFLQQMVQFLSWAKGQSFSVDKLIGDPQLAAPFINGRMAVVLVGAMIVAGIETVVTGKNKITWDEQFKANSIVVMGEALGHTV